MVLMLVGVLLIIALREHREPLSDPRNKAAIVNVVLTACILYNFRQAEPSKSVEAVCGYESLGNSTDRASLVQSRRTVRPLKCCSYVLNLHSDALVLVFSPSSASAAEAESSQSRHTATTKVSGVRIVVAEGWERLEHLTERHLFAEIEGIAEGGSDMASRSKRKSSKPCDLRSAEWYLATHCAGGPRDGVPVLACVPRNKRDIGISSCLHGPPPDLQARYCMPLENVTYEGGGFENFINRRPIAGAASFPESRRTGSSQGRMSPPSRPSAPVLLLRHAPLVRPRLPRRQAGAAAAAVRSAT
jgi:hypothetical protein